MTGAIARSLFLLFTILAIPLASTAQDSVSARVGKPESSGLSGAALENETKRVSSLLRCPVCQGLSVYDSPAPMAVNMRKEVSDLLSRGYSQDQVVRYFESSYGEFVRLDPKKEGLNLLVWILPIVALLFGGWGILSFRRNVRANAAPLTAETPPEELNEYVEKVRAVVRGDAEVRNAGV